MQINTREEKIMNNTFGENIIPDNDQKRLQALNTFKILDSSPEESFTHIAHMIARIFNVPVALISFVSKDEVFFKANFGYPDHTHAPRGVSLCSLAVLNDEVTLFENAKEEPCLMANPLVQGEFGLRFYAGAPLKTADGFNIGTVCIVDFKQRFFSKEQTKLLEDFATVVMNLLNLRRLAMALVSNV